MTHDQRIEAAAQALCKRWYGRHAVLSNLDSKSQEGYREDARAAIAAYLGNDVVVPREPTHEMLDALYEADTTGNPVDGWEAMLAASPLAERGKR